MNCVIDSVNNGGCDDGDNSSGDGTGNTDNDDNDDDDNANDEEGESFSRREFDCRKLILYTAKALSMYYNNYIYKELSMVSYNIGMRWFHEILQEHWKQCVNIFRIDATTLQSLCFDLETQYD